MQAVPVQNLEPGQVLAQDVIDRMGRSLLAQGVALTAGHIALLQRLGVEVVYLEVEAPPSPEPVSVSGLDWEFALNDAAHPLIAALREVRLRRGPAAADGPAPAGATPMEPVTIERLQRAERLAGELVKSVKTVVSPSAIYNRLVEVINHPLSSAKDIAEVIGTDQGLTVRLLRLVNSSIYGFPKRIESVERAVTLVGTRELSDLALATSIVRQFRHIPSGLIDPQRYWHHNFACALVARELALQGKVATDRAFTAGLLHDIGRVIMLMYFSEYYSAAITRARQDQRPLFEAELLEMHCDHAMLGAALLKMWSLPACHVESVGMHHRPSRARQFPQEAALTHVADIICNAMRWGTSGETRVPPLEAGAWERLYLAPGIIEQLPLRVVPRIDEAVNIFLNDD